MNESVVVYGPQGCGKTLSAKVLQSIYGLDVVVDDWDGAEAIGDGVLVLTNALPPYTANASWVSFSEAMGFKNWLSLQKNVAGGVDLLVMFLKRDENLPDDITSHEKLMGYLVSQSADNAAWDEARTVWSRYEDWLENFGVIY